MAVITKEHGKVFTTEGTFVVQATQDDALMVQRRVNKDFPWVDYKLVNGKNSFIFTNPVKDIQYRVVAAERVLLGHKPVEFAVVGEGATV